MITILWTIAAVALTSATAMDVARRRQRRAQQRNSLEEAEHAAHVARLNDRLAQMDRSLL